MEVTKKMVEEYITKNPGPYSLGKFKNMLSTLSYYGNNQLTYSAWKYLNKKFPFHINYYKQEGYIK